MTLISHETRRWTAADSLSLVGDVLGDPAAPPVIFVHGGGQTRRAWRSGAEAVAAAGFCAITIDQRGHGESDWSPRGDYSPQAGAADLWAIMDQLDQPAALVGASRGGYSALIAAAAKYGLAARALVLVEIAPRVDQSGVDQVRGFMRASALGFADVGEAADLLAGYMHRPRPTDLDRLRRAMLQGKDGRLYWRWDPKLAAGALTDAAQAETMFDSAARQIRCPVLLVRGALSELVKDEHVAHLQALVPHAEAVSIPGVGHMISGDENDLFNAAIVDFIERLPAFQDG